MAPKSITVIGTGHTEHGFRPRHQFFHTSTTPRSFSRHVNGIHLTVHPRRHDESTKTLERKTETSGGDIHVAGAPTEKRLEHERDNMEASSKDLFLKRPTKTEWERKERLVGHMNGATES